MTGFPVPAQPQPRAAPECPVRRRMQAVLVVALLAGCMSRPGPPVPPVSRAPLVTGSVQLPSQFRTQATSADLIRGAAVFLLAANGDTVASGTTDADGTFALYREYTVPYTPVDGDFYTLDLVKRYSVGAITNVLSLQTVLQWRTDGWTSVTGPTVVINPQSTAVTAIDDADPTIGRAQIMGVVGGAAFDTVTPFGLHGQLAVDARVAAIHLALTNVADPVAERPFVLGGNYTITSQASADALAAIDELTGDLTVNAPTLTLLNLPRLRHVGGNLRIGSFENNDANPLLATVSLPVLERVVGQISVVHAPQVANLGFLRPVQGAPQTLTIGDCAQLTDISGLAGIRGPLTTVRIEGNPRLASLHGLEGITAVDRLQITNNGALATLQGFAMLSAVTTLLEVTNNTVLPSGCVTDLQARTNPPAVTNTGNPAGACPP